jgi:superfamily II DNA helicase RecQ
MVSSRLLEHPMFGALDMLKPRDIMQFLQSLEAQGLLEAVTETEFPCVDISAAGRKWLQSPGSIKVNFPPLAAAGGAEKRSSRRSGVFADDDSLNNRQMLLFEELRRIRSEMAASKGIPAFQILSDATLKLLASVAPQSTAEAMQIRGIGPAKAATVLPRMLEAIRKWRKES